MKKMLIVCVALAGMAFVGNTSTADAGVRFHVQVGNGYGGYYGARTYNRTPYYYGRRHPFWNDTRHYDYYPSQFRRYRNYYHRTGHWDHSYRRGHRHHH